MTVNALSTGPVALADLLVVSSGGVAVADVLANDVDVDSSLVYAQVTIMASPVHGVAAVLEDGTGYTHDGSGTNVDSLTYQICDGGVRRVRDWLAR